MHALYTNKESNNFQPILIKGIYEMVNKFLVGSDIVSLRQQLSRAHAVDADAEEEDEYEYSAYAYNMHCICRIFCKICKRCRICRCKI